MSSSVSSPRSSHGHADLPHPALGRGHRAFTHGKGPRTRLARQKGEWPAWRLVRRGLTVEMERPKTGQATAQVAVEASWLGNSWAQRTVA
jgi:hypothetical protein